MKKIQIIFICLLTHFISFSQNKRETKDWIVEKCNQYKRGDILKNELTFNEDNLIYVKYMHGYFYEKIKIKNIYALQIKKSTNPEVNGEFYTIKIIAKGKEYGTIEDGEFIKMDDYGNEESETNIFLNLNFREDDLPKRMLKAFVKLIELYGGKATVLKEKF